MKEAATTGPGRVRAAAVAMILLAPLAVPAETTTTRMPLPQQQIRSSVPSATQPWHTARVGPHVFYGTIALIRGTVLTIRLRNGRMQVVDATAAIANGDYSAPLFVGKPVSVDGEVRGTVFTAAHITRLTDLTDLGADR